MAIASFPSDSNSRKAILILKQHDVEKCEYEPGAAKALLDDEVCVLQLPLPQAMEASTALDNIRDSGLMRSGLVLVQSPYDPDTYEDASNASQHFALIKHMLFSRLCMLLGAKEVKVEQIDLHTRSSKHSIKANGQAVGKGAEIDIESAELEKLRTQMNLHDSFSGGPPDVQAAENLLRQNGLWSDHTMKSLIEMRRDGGNKLTSRKLAINLSSETKSNLNVVGRLDFPTFIQFSADYKRAVEEQYDYTLTVLVEF